jgi:hypothetical protein
VGNVWEWQTLMKLVDGKIMMPSDNNIDLDEASWPDTSGRYDSTGGTAGGTGIDSSVGTIGAPVISDTISKYAGLPGTDTYYKEAHIGGESGFRSMTKKTDYTPPVSLILAGLAPITHYDGAYESGNELKGAVWVRNYGTRVPLCGARWADTSYGGLGTLVLRNPRTDISNMIGFRPAFLLV